jgi:hypothetical protein
MSREEQQAMIDAVIQDGLRHLAAHPEDYAGHPDDEGVCWACDGARTELRCVTGHTHGNCDCDDYEVPCHACR